MTMKTGLTRRLRLALVLTACLLPSLALAQGGLLGRVKKRVEDNVGRQSDKIVDCVMGDQACVDKAKADGNKVKIDSTKSAAPAAGEAPVVTSGGGGGSGGTGGGNNAVWANYDFVPGSKTIFFEDFKNDEIGNFPRRYEFQNGNIELVTFRDRPWVRISSSGQFAIPMPAVLPTRYTIEMDYWGTAGECWMYTDGTTNGGTHFTFGASGGGGLRMPGGSATMYGTDGTNLTHQLRILVDGTYAKVYIDARRVANVPNYPAEHGNKIGFYCDGGLAVGGIRVAESGRKLYDALTADGRVATQGIYFDTGSDKIRPESAPTLKEIAALVNDHDGLRLGIEGHTDNVGAAAANLDLSKRRAEAVKAYLVATLHVDAARLEASGLGSTKPAQPNTTTEGRQTNRRVELVKLP
jgi:outer membrane protein OmpA-like peptidoglycan-associated protein